MKEQVIAKVQACYKNAVTSAVAKGSNTRWGGAESTSVIEELVGLLQSDDEVAAEGFDAIREYVSNVINPSAFAQALEELPLENPRHIRRPEKGGGKGKKTAGL